MKRQRITIGSILEINIENEYYTYAQILAHGICVFYDYQARNQLKDFSILENAPLLFFLCVYNQVITQGDWLKVGKMPIREDCKTLPNQFIQDMCDPDKVEMYITETGEIVPSTKEECIGLERCAVWDSNHVEDRIRDHYLGVPCIWVEPIILIKEEALKNALWFTSSYKKYLNLIDQVDINYTTKSGKSFLHLAIASIHFSEVIVNDLINRGADINCLDSENRSPLEYCCEHNRINIAKILLEKGANVNTTDKWGNNPLWIAVSKGNKEMVELLMAYEANPNNLNKEGETPLNLAKRLNDQKMIALLTKQI